MALLSIAGQNDPNEHTGGTLTELIWKGKYDNDGRRAAPLRVALPFQTVETVNESAQERQRMLDLWTARRDTEWRNRLIWGDKKYVLPALLEEFAGKVDLIYIDPPFDTGADFSFHVDVNGSSFTKEPSVIELKAYRDTWAGGMDSYLHWLHDTLALLRELLSEDGSLYLHLDYHVGAYGKVVADEVFGRDSLLNEIVWKRTSARSDSHTFNHIHDCIYLYAKSSDFKFNSQLVPHEKQYLDRYYTYTESDGRKFATIDATQAGLRTGDSGVPWRSFSPASKGNHWKFAVSELDRLDSEGRIYWPNKQGGWPRLKAYLDEVKGAAIQSIWTDLKAVNSQAGERTDYPTQKPESLLERIIQTSSNDGDLVFDCFCGSGTTAAVAERLSRRWISCDLSRFAIHTTRKRLLSLVECRPFVVQNLGKYERQLWQVAEFGAEAEVKQATYRRFIMELYNATPVSGYAWLHGLKGGRMVYRVQEGNRNGEGCPTDKRRRHPRMGLRLRDQRSGQAAGLTGWPRCPFPAYSTRCHG